MNDLSEKEQLARELRDRSHDVGGHPIGFESVKTSARRIQRRRRIVSGAVAAVVLAVAVPAGIAVTGNLNQTSPSPIAPSPNVTKTATPRPDGPVTLTMSGLARGADPQVPYVAGVDRQLVTPDGSLDLPVTMQTITRFGDGWVGLGYDGRGTSEIFFLDADLNITDRQPSGQTLKVSSDGSRVAYVLTNDDGSQTLVNAAADGSGQQTWDFSKRPVIEPAGFVAADAVVYQTAGERPVIGMASQDGTTELQGFLGVKGTNLANGLVAGQTRTNPDTSGCFGVMDPAASTTEMVWETCDHSLSSFSPNGQFVLAAEPQLSGLGTRVLSILDAETGELVVTYRQPRDSQIAVTQTVWEDNDTVLAIANEGQTWQFLRMDVAGELEAASDPLQADPFADFPFWFASSR